VECQYLLEHRLHHHQYCLDQNHIQTQNEPYHYQNRRKALQNHHLHYHLHLIFFKKEKKEILFWGDMVGKRSEMGDREAK
jgi:hypothetical protein